MKSSLILLVLTLIANMSSASSQDTAILSFTQSADFASPQGTITYYCTVTGSEARYALWRINGYSIQGANSMVVSQSGPDPVGSSNYSLWITIRALSDNNNTRISCDAYHQRLTRNFIIAGPPLKPDPKLRYSDEGLSLAVTWDEPFTQHGFGITYYTLQVINDSVPTTFLNMSLHRMYTDNITALPVLCYDLEYIITAHNEIGSSSRAVRGGFPITVAPVDMQWRVLYQLNGDPHLEVWFEPTNSCLYQDVHYSVYLVDDTGNSTLLNSSNYLYTVHTGLTSGARYTVVVEASSIAGLTTTRQEIAINKQQFCSDRDQQMMPALACLGDSDQQMMPALSAVSGAFGVIVVVFFVLVLVVIICFVSHRKKWLLKKNQSPVSFNEIVTSTPRPASLQTKCAANPIYEGPFYESPNGEPLRALLGSTPNTPNTPLDSPRYVFDVLPPNPPPPRKSSTASLHDNPDALPLMSSDVVKTEGTLEASVIETAEDAYTVMRSANVRASRASKPSPLVIPPALSTLSEV